MKTIFAIALALLLFVVAGSVYVSWKRSVERARLGEASEAYRAREEALLKARMAAQAPVTRIQPVTAGGVPAATPGPGRGNDE